MQCRALAPSDADGVLAIINDAALAYRGVIPADCWHEPYMTQDELQRELTAQVAFDGVEVDGVLCGVMGLQDRGEVVLIRHAYVAPAHQRTGVGGQLLQRLLARTAKPVLIGTWAAATWAIDFYRRHGFRVVSADEKTRLLERYWAVPARQREASIVLADSRWPSLDAQD
jgi:N-acetylglutamate synthase-like GNAT family acetyltransferase